MPRLHPAAIAAVAIAAVILARPAAAQRPPGAPPGGPGGPGAPAAILAEMSKRLNLTAAQKAKIKPVLEDQQKKMMALYNDHSMSNDQKRQKFLAMMGPYRDNVRKVLTPDQQKKMDQWQAEMRARYQGGPGGGPGGPPGGPPH